VSDEPREEGERMVIRDPDVDQFGTSHPRPCPPPGVTYWRPRQPVEAVRLTGEADWDAVAAWCGGEVRRAGDGTGADWVLVPCSGVSRVAHEGDWVVRAGDAFTVMGDGAFAAFAASHEPVPPAAGPAVPAGPVMDLLEAAWRLIGAASSRMSDPDDRTAAGWREDAARWRDRYEAAARSHAASREAEPGAGLDMAVLLERAYGLLAWDRGSFSPGSWDLLARRWAEGYASLVATLGEPGDEPSPEQAQLAVAVAALRRLALDDLMTDVPALPPVRAELQAEAQARCKYAAGALETIARLGEPGEGREPCDAWCALALGTGPCDCGPGAARELAVLEQAAADAPGGGFAAEAQRLADHVSIHQVVSAAAALVAEPGEPGSPLRAVGERIRAARAGVNVGQSGLARMLGVTQTAVSYWEAGKRDPGVAGLLEVADALGVEPGSLLPDRAGPSQPDPSLPPGEYARVEIMGHDSETGWVTDGTRAGTPVMVVRDWDGRVVAEIPGASLYRYVPLPTPLRRPERQPGATGLKPCGCEPGQPCGADCLLESTEIRGSGVKPCGCTDYEVCDECRTGEVPF
jgi:DNA-binding XRE family transcriptional regulator